jgi:hypothetical protein
MSATGFGRKGLTQADAVAQEIANKREAFIAAERARRAEEEPTEARYHGNTPSRPMSFEHRSEPTGGLAKSQKSLMLAYALWFFACTISAHRFYLGAYRSALAQVGLFYGGLLLLFIETHDRIMPASQFTALAAIALGAWGLALLWMLVDAFLIPGVRRRMAEGSRPRDLGAVFT